MDFRFSSEKKLFSTTILDYVQRNKINNVSNILKEDHGACRWCEMPNIDQCWAQLDRERYDCLKRLIFSYLVFS